MEAVKMLSESSDPLALIGRQQDIDRILAAMRSATARCVTIVGPGGVGKTRLAQEITHITANAQAAWFVPLAPVTDVRHVPAVIAAAMGNRLAEGDLAWTMLARSLADRPVTLVLDNLEQIPDLASELTRLLAETPQLTILATSRRALQVAGEVVVRLDPLPTGDTEDDPTALSPAAALFVARAQAMRPSFAPDADERQLIEELCRRVDGLPLAVELAAAQIRTLSVRSLVHLLDHERDQLLHLPTSDDRQDETLAESIARSYRRLDADQQMLFRRLALFPAGATPSLAGAVIPTPERALRTLMALADQHLLEEMDDPDGTPRFRMLETIRSYALGVLADDPDRDTLDAALVAAFTRHAREIERARYGPDEPAAIDVVEREFVSIRAVMRHVLDETPAEVMPVDAIADLLVALEPVMLGRGYVVEGQEWVARIVPRLQPESPHLASLWLTSGRLHAMLGAHGIAIEHLTRAAGLASSPVTRAWADYERGAIWRNQGDLDRARQTQQVSYVTFTELGIVPGIVRAGNSLGVIAMDSGDYPEARRWFDRTLELTRSTRNVVAESMVLLNLGYLATLERDYMRAIAVHEDVERLSAPTQNLGNMAANYMNWAGALIGAGQLDRADEIEAKALVLMRRLGNIWGEGIVLYARATIARRRRDVLRERDLLLDLLPLRRAIGAPQPLIATLASLARSWSEDGAMARAVATLDEAEAIAVAATGDPWRAGPFHRALCDWHAGGVDASAAVRASLLDLHAGGDLTVLRECLSFLDESLPGQGIGEIALRETIRKADLTSLAIPPRDAHRVAEPRLSARERSVLALIVDGKTDRQIAETLFITPRTAGFHVSNILRKLQVTSRAEAAAWAARHLTD